MRPEDAAVRFVKVHGLGNDFVVFDGAVLGRPLSAEVARALCDRHHGIGADGVLTLWPHAGVAGRMQVHNSDGSESAMCGNGLRCLARWLYDEGRVAATEPGVTLGAGERRYEVERLAPDRYRVHMAAAELVHPELPAGMGARGRAEHAVGGRSFAATCVHLGNPHAVIFADEPPRPLAERYGAPIERYEAFVHGANVSFAKSVPGGFEAVVHERGAGLTRACGSGACAIGAAAVLEGRWRAGTPMRVALPGGELVILVHDSGAIDMEGPAVRVFSGEVVLP